MNNNIKKYLHNKYVAYALGAALIIAVFYILFCFDSEESDFIEEVKANAISANVLLINESETQDYISYSGGQSGVIFDRTNERYYVLTALHGVPTGPESKNERLLVLGYDQPEYWESGRHVGLIAYYSQFPEAVVEYYDDDFDLAVVSFQSRNTYTVLPIAAEPPENNELVAVMGNPSGGDRNTVVTGRVTSKKPIEFGTKASDNQHDTIQNSAKTSSGFSGGALLNKDLEIVGIHLGALVNIFKQFKTSCAMPCNKTLDFLAGWNK